MDLLVVLELKFIETSNKKNDLKEFSYIGKKFDILERIGKLICRAVIRKERENIKQYIQENYSTELSKIDLSRNCFRSIFVVNDDYDWVVYDGIELTEHLLHLCDILPHFNQECEKVFKDIESHSLKLF